ncbi:MAG: ADP-ribosylation factor-like protein [Promethearchaeota archaeon]
MPSLAITGLSNAGKTSLADVCFIGKSINEVMADMVPTVGLSTLKFKYLDFSVNMIDLGGQKSFRDYYLSNTYLYRGLDLLIHVLDVQDQKNFEESRNFFDQILNALKKEDTHPQICVFLHKFDPEMQETLKMNIEEASTLFQGFPIFKTSILDNSCHDAFRKILLDFRPEFANKIRNILTQFKGILVEIYIVDTEGWVVEYAGERGMSVKGSLKNKKRIKALTSLYSELFEGGSAHISLEGQNKVIRIYPLSPQLFLFVSYPRNQEWNKNLHSMIKSLVKDMRVAVKFLET